MTSLGKELSRCHQLVNLGPSCMTHVSEVVQANKGNPAQAISFLIDNYHGQTAVCGLLGKWILDLKQQQQQQCNNADEIRTTCSSVIDKVIKERFAKDVADRIVDLSKSEAAFLEDMMDSPNWRKLLIDLNYSQGLGTLTSLFG